MATLVSCEPAEYAALYYRDTRADPGSATAIRESPPLSAVLWGQCALCREPTAPELFRTGVYVQVYDRRQSRTDYVAFAAVIFIGSGGSLRF